MIWWRRVFMVMVAFLTLRGASAPAGEAVLIGPSYRIFPGSVSQTETFITRHPLNPGVLFVSANTVNQSTGFISEGVYVTTDGGSTWSGSDTCKGAPIAFHRGDPGIAIDREGRFILIRLGFSPGLYSHFSTDNGRTWSGQRTVATDDQDRATLASDGDATSAFYGRSYAVWVRFSPPYPVVFSQTDNGGQTWSAPAQINAPSQRGQGGEVVLGPDGRMAVCWAGVIGTSPFTEDFVGFASSTDGGTTWAVVENAFDMNGIAGLLSQKGNIRVNGLPRMAADRTSGPRRGWLYVVTTDRNLSPAGADPDIIMHRSTNNGVSWSGGIRVNQDQVNNGRIQYFPAIHVDEGGGVNIIFHDDRTTTSDSSTVFLGRSTDGGDTWSEYPLSDHSFRPQPFGGLGQGYQGDNIGLTSVADTLWPVWMDNSTGIYQVWTTKVVLSELGTDVELTERPIDFHLAQNYPNPFNGGTKIRYRIQDRGDGARVTLKVHDVLGQEVARLVDGRQQAGDHEVEFDAARYSLPSGMYLYTLTAGTFRATRTMLLLQ